jgi:sugar/nucleoside kinase (ribokinase family)
MNKKIINCPAFANQVKDKIGTGDTMLALLSIAIYKKLDLRFCMLLSSIAAAYNIRHMANSTPLSRGLIIKAVQSYLK